MEEAAAVPMDELLAHRQWVRALARRLAADESSADDLEQETWLAAVERPPRDARSVRGWLGTVVRNLHRNTMRGDARRERRETARPVRDAEPGAPELVAEAETQHALVREVLDLDEPYRSTVLLRWYEELTRTQIAERTGVSVDTVKTRLRRAVERLRERMDARHGGDRKAWCLLALGRGDGDGTATGTTAALTGAAGGVAMGATAKAGIAAAVLVAVGALVWWTRTDDAPPAAPPAETAAVPAPTQPPRPSRHDATADATPDATSASASPAAGGADPAHPDRDLDLHGVVVGLDAAPVAGAKVQVVEYPWRRAGQVVNFMGMFEGRLGDETKSTESGAFALRLRRGDSKILRVSADGLSAREMGPYQSGQRVRIVLTRAVKLHVTVRDTGGAPVAAARLWLLAFGKGDEPWMDFKATTGADGRCTFEGLPGGAQAGLTPLSGAGDFGSERFTLPADGEKSIEIVSPSDRILTGRVFDAVTLAPVEGARVGGGVAQFGSATTDGGGRFEIRGWTGKSSHDLHVLAAGYGRACVAIGADAPLEIALRRGFVTVGRVLGADGAPVPGACVGLNGARRGGSPGAISLGSVLTGDDGRFRIADLDRAAMHSFTAFAPAHGRIQRDVAPPAEGTDVVDLGDVALTVPRAIEGVVYSTDGSPAPGVDIRLGGPGKALAGSGDREDRRTDDLGRFRFADLGPGEYTVEARIPGGPSHSTRVTLPTDRDVTDVVLPPKPSGTDIIVRVIDEAGAPVPGMNVIGSGAMRGSVITKSDAKGIAVLAPPDEGRLTRIAVGAQGDAEAFLRNPYIQVEPGRREYVAKMERGAHVTCRLLDPDGKPLGRATVSVEPGDRAYYFSFPDAEGRIRLTLPRQGEFSVVFHGAVYVGDKGLPTDSGLEARMDGVTAASGEIELRCRPVETGRTATVRVLAADGSPVAGAEVRIGAMSGTERKVSTDAEGRARFDDLLAREFSASAPYKPGSLAAQWIKFVPAGQEVVLQYPAAVAVTGAVFLPGGAPAPGASVNVMRGESGVFMTNADRDGRFTVQVPVGDEGPFKLNVGAIVDKVLYGGERAFAPQDRDVRVDLTKR